MLRLHFVPVLRFAAFCLLLLMSPWLRAAEDALLDPEQAFPFSARMYDAATIEGRFVIAQGYYLYKDKLHFAVEGAKLGRPALPPGQMKEDEFFGKVEVYHGEVRVRLPISNSGSGPIILTAGFQGCADKGICYLPSEVKIRLQPAAASPGQPVAPTQASPRQDLEPISAAGAATETQSPELIARLKELAGDLAASSGDTGVLAPEEAFQLQLSVDPEGRLQANFSIAPQHYLYRDKIGFEVRAPTGVSVKDLKLPEAEVKDDPNLGPMHIYHDPLTVNGRLDPPLAAGTKVDIAATYQGCSEQGICYPPIEQVISVTVAATQAPAASTSESGRIAALLEGGNFWLIVVSFFGFGLLLALTPCVFPMIPILSGIIVGHGHHVTKRRGFILSLAYVLGMAVTYALAGVAAGMSGTLISNALQNPWALGVGAAIFVALAFSMFGFYELQLPSFLQSRFTEASNRIKGGTLTSVFIMGAISALIVGPCVAAPLAGALLYISQTGNTALGGISLFFLALGMGMPLLLVGLSAGALLPRAGGWMEAIKKFFGVLLIGVAIWLVSPLFPEIVQLLAWAALLIISGVYLHALDPLPTTAGGWQRFWKGIGIITLVTGGALLLGALGGSRDVLQPLSIFKGGTASAAQQATHLEFKRVGTIAELDAAIQAAEGHHVMLDFYADWCVSCKELERFTFSDPRVQARLDDVVLLQVDVTGNTPDDKALLKRFSLFGPPGIIFFDPNGRELPFRVIGYEPADKFLNSLDQVLVTLPA